MDANKLQKLREVGYVVIDCCAVCESGQFQGGPAQRWGTCAVHQYEHLKHSENPRQMSVCAFGFCPQFKLSETQKALMGSWTQFMGTLVAADIKWYQVASELLGSVLYVDRGQRTQGSWSADAEARLRALVDEVRQKLKE